MKSPIEKQIPLKKPSKTSAWGNYFKEFLMIFLCPGSMVWV
jgi:hypothetical protein